MAHGDKICYYEKSYHATSYDKNEIGEIHVKYMLKIAMVYKYSVIMLE